MKARYIEKQIPGAITPMETEGRRLFRFIASQQVRDLDGDTVIAEGVDFTSYYFARGAGPLVLYHDQTRVVGKTLRLGVEALNGIPSLVGIGEIDPPNTGVEADRTWAQLKSGSLNATSIAFLVPPDGAERVPDGGRLLRKILLIHIALVSQPALASAAVLETANAKSCAVCAPEVDLAAQTASVEATLRRAAQFEAKLLAADFQRITDREREARERPYGYVLLAKGSSPRIEAAVARFASWAAADLGIQAPEARLFREARAGEAPDFRMARPAIGVHFNSLDGIAVDGSLSAEELAGTTAHEVAHANGADEREAEAFARKFVESTYRLKTGGGGPRAGYPMPGMTYDEKGIPSFGREDETRVIVTHRSF